MVDSNETCPDCGAALVAISPWYYVCGRRSCQKRVPRYEWLTDDDTGGDDE